MSGSLSGRKALVTGGTRGIGAAIARRLMADGAAVAVTGTSPDGTGPEGSTYKAIDFNDTAATEAFARSIADEGFDILVNNAGINKISPFGEIDTRRISSASSASTCWRR
jgi:NAD(P)-dependent dehydrogenase (short-subunit alcohol dehydrogenase family)